MPDSGTIERKYGVSETLYRAVFENTGTAMTILEEDMVISLANSRFESLSGYSRAEIEGRMSWTDFTHPEDLAWMKEQHRLRREDPKKARTQYEFRFVSRLGEIYNVLLTSDLIPGTTTSVASLMDITAMKKAENALQESEIRLSNAMDLAQLVNWEYDLPTGEFIVDDRFFSLYGTSLSEEGSTRMTVDTYIREFVHPEDASLVSEQIHKNIQCITPIPFPQIQHRIIRRDGEVRHIIVRLMARPDREGRILRLFGANQDITGQILVEERLSALNHAFLAFNPDPLDNINLLTGVAGRMLNGACALYNRLDGGMLCSLGTWNTPPDYLPVDRPEGHICYDLIKDGGDVPRIITSLLTSSYAKTDPNVVKYRLDSYVGIPVKIGDKFLGSLCVVYQNTCAPGPGDLELLTFLAKAIAIEDERRSAGLALGESERRYRILAENAPVGILACNKRGEITFVNPKMLSMLGSPSEEKTRGINLLTFPPLVRCGFSEVLEEALRTGVPRDSFEAEYQSVWGKTLYYRGHISSLIGDSFENGALIIIDDITERKLADDALKLANKKLNLLSGINRHDIGNQIMALEAVMGLSEDVIDDRSELVRLIGIEKRIIENILYHIASTRDYEDMGVNTPVWNTISRLVADISASTPRPDISVEYTGNPSLEIYADPLFSRVFFNLIDNALRHGGEKVTRIRVSDRNDGERLIISVEDDGTGISPGDKDQLFTKGFGKHTGLGLFLSREILSITGISITESGTPGKGACFELSVPKGAYRFVEDNR